MQSYTKSISQYIQYPKEYLGENQLCRKQEDITSDANGPVQFCMFFPPSPTQTHRTTEVSGILST